MTKREQEHRTVRALESNAPIYHQMIAKATGRDIAAAPYIEAWMRLANPTLDGLTTRQFQIEALIAVDCMAASSDADNVRLAESQGTFAPKGARA